METQINKELVDLKSLTINCKLKTENKIWTYLTFSSHSFLFMYLFTYILVWCIRVTYIYIYAISCATHS